MKNAVVKMILFSTLLMMASSAFAQHRRHSRVKADEEDHMVLGISTGFQQENFNWSIAGDGVNVLSELKWKNVRAIRTGISWQYNITKNISVEGNFSRAFIAWGSVTDTDYASDNRTDPVYNQTFDADKGHVNMYGGTIGYTFFPDKKFSITPRAGYVINQQLLYLLDHEGNTSYQLKSSYKTNWHGWTIGAVGKLSVSEKFSIVPSIQYQQLDYSAQADWNLILQFQHPVSFEHSAKGYCVDTSLKLPYVISSHWSLFLLGTYGYWHTGKGIDTLYEVNAAPAKTQLNSIHRDSMSVSFGAQVSF